MAEKQKQEIIAFRIPVVFDWKLRKDTCRRTIDLLAPYIPFRVVLMDAGPKPGKQLNSRQMEIVGFKTE